MLATLNCGKYRQVPVRFVLRLRRRPMGARNLGGWPNRWSQSGPNRAIGNGGGRTCVGEKNRREREIRYHKRRERNEREKKENRNELISTLIICSKSVPSNQS